MSENEVSGIVSPEVAPVVEQVEVKAGKPQTSDEVFVTAYVTNIANGVKAVAKALDMSESNVYVRAKGLRKRGVELPEPPAGKRGRQKGVSTKTNTEALKALIANLTGKSTVVDSPEQAESPPEETKAE